MKRTLLALATITLWLAATLVASAENPGGELFNGKDLDNFDGLKSEYWSVQDGAIVGTTTKPQTFNTFLCSKKQFGDFELKFQVRLKGTERANSGVQVRSEIFDKEKFAVKGPQCDMGQIYWGSLYGEKFGGMMQAAPKEVVAKVLKQGEFNDYYIKVVGTHVTIKLNGETTVDADFAKVPAKGIIAFQLHQGPPMEVTFKNIQFKTLK